MSFLGREASHFPPPERRLRLGFVGGGRGSFIGAVHANGASPCLTISFVSH